MRLVSRPVIATIEISSRKLERRSGPMDDRFLKTGVFLAPFHWYLGIWLGNQMTEPTMPVTWNHRVLVFEEHGEKSYCIHEVHYDDDGSILGWTANAIAVCSMRRSIIC